MESLSNLLYGFSICLQPANLLYCFIGVLFGTLVGVLPGIGSTAAIALLLPATFRLPSSTAIIMLAGIYYGCMYGGSTTSILVNIPGESSSVMTCLDGYMMAKQGRAGRALGISAFGSFIGGTVAIMGLMLVAPPLANLAMSFGPPEYTVLMVLGIVLLCYLGQESMISSLMTASLGFFLGTVGLDNFTTTPRFTYGMMNLMDGIGVVPILMGLFGIPEVLINLEHPEEGEIFSGKIKGLLPTLRDWIDSAGAMARGTLLGFFVGILPGGGATLASFLSYSVEKRVAKNPEQFGKGAIQGVAGPETANNAGAGGAFIPLLSMGIPSNATVALLMGALLVHGVQPGPSLMSKHPDVFWGVVASMYVGNIMLLILNLPLIGLWVKVLRIPYSILFPFILLFCLVGTYSTSNATSDLYLLAVFAVIGYFMKKLGLEAAPLILAFILGPLLETASRQSLLLSGGSFWIFFSRPVSAALLGIVGVLILFNIYRAITQKGHVFSRQEQ
jgi:putative tricarboxylic transport membrane protein